MPKLRSIPVWLKLLVSAALLSYFLSRTDLQALVAALASIPPGVLVLAALLFVAAFFVSTGKWKLIAPFMPFAALAKAGLVGQYYGLVLPGQIAGEVSKVFYLRRHGVATAPELTASIGIDKATGLIGSVFVLGTIGTVFSDYPLPAAVKVVFIAGLIASLALVFFLRIPALYRLVDGLFSTWDIPAVRELLSHWKKITEHPLRIAASIACAVLSQVLAVMIAVVVGGSLGIHVGFFDWCWILSILSVVLLLPVTVGGLGLREGSLVTLLALFGAAPEAALALSFTLFGLQILLAVIGAIYEHIPVRTV